MHTKFVSHGAALFQSRPTEMTITAATGNFQNNTMSLKGPNLTTISLDVDKTSCFTHRSSIITSELTTLNLALQPSFFHQSTGSNKTESTMASFGAFTVSINSKESNFTTEIRSDLNTILQENTSALTEAVSTLKEIAEEAAQQQDSWSYMLSTMGTTLKMQFLKLSGPYRSIKKQFKRTPTSKINDNFVSISLFFTIFYSTELNQ